MARIPHPLPVVTTHILSAIARAGGIRHGRAGALSGAERRFPGAEGTVVSALGAGVPGRPTGRDGRAEPGPAGG
ncbi:hypothetical protein GCM10009605_03980 [Nocardiopsis composta]